jgi:hypothetical protein
MSSSLSRSHPPPLSDNESISSDGKPYHNNATELVLPAEADVDDNFLDNYELDAEGNDEHSLSRKMVHYCGGVVIQEHWLACKEVLVFYAGSSTSKLSSMTKVTKEAACLLLYKACIAALDVESFSDEARDYFGRAFRRKDEPMTAEPLYRHYNESRLKLRNVLFPLYPKNLVTMKSGKGFHESCNAVYVTAYRLEMSKLSHRGELKYSAEQVSKMYPPNLWEYTKSPWCLGLTMKIFRRDPQIAPKVADVMTDPANIPVPRAVLKRQKQQEKQLASVRRKLAPPEENEVCVVDAGDDHYYKRQQQESPNRTRRGGRQIGVSAASTTNTTAAADNKKLLWAKVLVAKSQAESTNIAKRMGKIEELEKAMSLLDRMRDVIGEVSYANRVQHVLAAFPVFATFEKCVDVIEIDDDDDAEDAAVLFNPTVSNKEPPVGSVVLNSASDETGSSILNDDDNDEVLEAVNADDDNDNDSDEEIYL